MPEIHDFRGEEDTCVFLSSAQGYMFLGLVLVETVTTSYIHQLI